MISEIPRQEPTHRAARAVRLGRIARLLLIAVPFVLAITPHAVTARGEDSLRVGAAKVDITDPDAGPTEPPLYARAVVIRSDSTTVVVVAVDAVAIGEIGYIANSYLTEVRARVERELGIDPQHLLINASHCHGVVCDDVADRTFHAIRQASEHTVPVRVGVGRGEESRVSENRRLRLKSGREVDVRHAYSLPPDDEVAAVGPIDPEIGLLRVESLDGHPVAVLYNFACHPIQGIPSGQNTADLTGYSSQVIEQNLGGNAVALFLQGCAGDINPIGYKAMTQPRDAEPLGNRLGLATLQAYRDAEFSSDARLALSHRNVALPRADLAPRIAAMETERDRLVRSFNGTTLNLESFLRLVERYDGISSFPTAPSYRYLHEEQMNRRGLTKLDADNRKHLRQYVANVRAMEALTRLNTNLALLKKHQADFVDSGTGTVDVELLGLRVGEFVLTTFPGELTVPIGLGIKARSPHPHTFVAGYTNGYIYYAPTSEQLRNVGGAQEDSDCILAPEWQAIYDKHVDDLLSDL